MRDLLAAREVQIGEREIFGALAPDLDACKAVQLELEPCEWVVRRRALPRLPIDDLPWCLDRLAEHCVDPSRHREPLHPQEERSFGEQRHLPREPAGEEG